MSLIQELLHYKDEYETPLIEIFNSVRQECLNIDDMLLGLTSRLKLSANKIGLLEDEIKTIDGMINGGTHDKSGIIEYPEANPIVKYGYNIATIAPSTILRHIKIDAEERGFFDMINAGRKTYSPIGDEVEVENVESKDLVWMECIYFVLCGFEYAEYMGQLRKYQTSINSGNKNEDFSKTELTTREKILLLDYTLKLRFGNDPLSELMNSLKRSQLGGLFGYLLSEHGENCDRYIRYGRYHAKPKDDIFNANSIKKVNNVLNELGLPLIKPPKSTKQRHS